MIKLSYVFLILSWMTFWCLGETFEWNLQLESGQAVRSSVNVINRCKLDHTFHLQFNGSPFLTFPKGAECVVPAGGSVPVPVRFDLKGINPGEYVGEIIILCVTCRQEPTCHQDKEILIIKLQVTEAVDTSGESSSVQEEDSAFTTVLVGYPLPSDVRVGTPVSTGQTTGVIAEMEVCNNGEKPVRFPSGPVLIPPMGPFQGYVLPGDHPRDIPPGQTRKVSLEGYALDAYRKPPAAGESIPGPDEWIVLRDPKYLDGSGKPSLTSTFPGTVKRDEVESTPVSGSEPSAPTHIDVNRRPTQAVLLIFQAVLEIGTVYDELRRDGKIETPLSGEPDKERQMVIQHTLWRYTGALSGEDYTKDAFKARLAAEYQNKPDPLTDPEKRERTNQIQQNTNRFWDTFELVGRKAKVIK